MSSSSTCPKCGAPVSADSPNTPCLACLMQIGLATWQEGASPGEREENAPTDIASVERSRPTIDSLREEFPGMEIEELLGEGGMGAVYKARQQHLDRHVALKVIRRSSDDHPQFAERFAQEARALAYLNHPSIVTVHDFGQTDSYYFLVMEFVDGLNLRELIRAGNLTPQSALGIVPTICDALQYAHDEGVVHRDIKPENILVDRRGRVKIADFGLAKLLGSEHTHVKLTKTNQVMGTVHYMAPEQVERPTDVDHRADIYSLGVVFYELLTGELPLGRFAPPSAKVQIDVRLDEIVMQTLAKEPHLRYQRVGDVKTDMQSLDRHEQPPSRQSFVRQATQPLKNHQPASRAAYAKQVATRPGSPLQQPTEQSWLANFFGVVLNPQSYLRIGYLLASLPLGIIYFVVCITALSLGAGTLVIWVGIFILLGGLFAARAFGSFEATLVERLLGIPIASSAPIPSDGSFWGRAKRVATDGSTWSALLYAFLKLPLGILSFSLTVSLLAVPVALMLAMPLRNQGWFQPTIGSWQIGSPPEFAVVSMLGVFMFIISLHLINGLAWLSGQFARLMLRKAE